MKRLHLITLSLCALLFVIAPTSAQKHHQDYTRVNLVSDIDGVARFTDPHLVNPWGLALSASSPFWIADNNGNVSTLYNGRGQAFPVGSPLVVNIPAPGAPTGGTPTGLVFNGTGEFSVTANGKSGVVTGVSLRAVSFVLATMQNDVGVSVSSAVPDVAGSKITINLSKAVPAGKTAKIAWFVVN